MELTNDIKAKVLAQYLGSWIKLATGLDRTLIAVGGIGDEPYIKLRLGEAGNKQFVHAELLQLSTAKLILKPLSAITDEDAIEVANIAMRRHNRHYKPGDVTYKILTKQAESEGKIFYIEVGVCVNAGLYMRKEYKVRLEKNDVSTCDWVNKTGGSNKDYFTPNTFEIFQFLQMQGYDLPQRMLDGKTLHEAGLAIYE